MILNRLVLIDGKSVFYRGYYAMGNLSLPDGTPTGGIYGFAAISMEIVKRLNPTKVIVAWDSKTSVSKRRALYPEYKAGRVKPGDDFYAQIPLLKNLILALGWSFVEVDDYEADDIIGTFSREADETLGPDGKCEYETYIISSDLDMLQIVDENTHMWRIVKGFSNIEKIDIAEIEAKYGIKKSQFLDLKALKGDASDNIPGVPGVGEKTAAKLLNDYGTLDGVYENLDKITGSTRTKLEAGKDSAYLSQRLAKIMFDAPVDLTKIPDFVWDHERVISALKALQFNSLIRKFSSQFEGETSSSLGPRPSGPSPRADGANSRAAALRNAPNWDDTSDINNLKVALIGRPNVGKSSLFNSLAKKQQAVVSSRQGTTRDVNRVEIRYKGRTIEILDTAGLRKPGKREVGIEKFSAIRSLAAIEEADVCALLVDATEPHSKLDQSLAGQIVEAGKGIIVVLTKSDLVEGTEYDSILDKLEYDFNFLPYAPVLITSSETGENVTKLFELATEIDETRHQQIKTSDLNKILNDAIISHTPAGLKNTRPKPKYIVQTDTCPPWFVVHGHDLGLLHWSWKRFLERKIREQYPFVGTPIMFSFKNDKNDQKAD